MKTAVWTRPLKSTTYIATEKKRHTTPVPSWSASGVDCSVWRITTEVERESEDSLWCATGNYRITHVPSGCTVPANYKSIAAAARVLRKWAPLVAEYTAGVNQAGVERSEEGFVFFCREHKHGLRRCWGFVS